MATPTARRRLQAALKAVQTGRRTIEPIFLRWLFIGSELAGERAAMIMSLLQSAKLNGADPWSYLKDVLTRLPSQLNSRIGERLPHRWKPGT